MPPGQARMVDGWSDYTGCWADLYDDDYEEMRACEANPDPESALGLCAEHDAKLATAGSGRRPQVSQFETGLIDTSSMFRSLKSSNSWRIRS
jgi:hypothetical protein